MIEKRVAIPVGEAVQKVMEVSKDGEFEQIPIQYCDGRFLGSDLIAEQPIPAFDRSGFDGYAIRSQDLRTASLDHPIELEVLEGIGAGSVPTVPVHANQAVRLMTGAQMPVGADAVIMLELTEEFLSDGKKKVRIKRPVKSGDNVIYRGQDLSLIHI